MLVILDINWEWQLVLCDSWLAQNTVTEVSWWRQVSWLRVDSGTFPPILRTLWITVYLLSLNGFLVVFNKVNSHKIDNWLKKLLQRNHRLKHIICNANVRSNKTSILVLLDFLKGDYIWWEIPENVTVKYITYSYSKK